LTYTHIFCQKVAST